MMKLVRSSLIFACAALAAACGPQMGSSKGKPSHGHVPDMAPGTGGNGGNGGSGGGGGSGGSGFGDGGTKLCMVDCMTLGATCG